MEPISFVTSAGTLIGCTAKLVKLLHSLHGTLEDAPLLLSSIITECTIVYTSLCVIQDRQNKLAALDSGTVRSDQVADTFDIALSGCALILSVLEKDVQSCIVAGKSPQDAGAIKRAKLILSHSHLQELVSQLRGQQQALTLLLSTLQSQSIDEMRENVQGSQDLLHGIARVAKRFYVESEYDPSVADTSAGLDQSLEIDSVITSTRFAFDAEVLASKRYQRTLEYLHRIENRQAELKDLKTVTGGNIDQSRIAPRDVSERPVGNDATDPIPKVEDPPISTGIHHQQDPAKSSVGLTGHADESSDASSTTYVLPEISIGVWDLNPNLSSNFFVRDPGTGSSTPSPSETNIDSTTARKKRVPNYSLPYLTIHSKAEFEGLQRTKSNGAPAATSSHTLDHPSTGQAQLSPDFVSPITSANSQQPIRPSIEWLNRTFDTVWAHDTVGKMHSDAGLIEKEVVFVGDPCVGITSAIKRAVSGNWMVEYKPTVLDKYSLNVALDGVTLKLKLWDTAGEHFDHLRPLAYAKAQVVVIGYSVDSPDSLANVREKWVGEVSSLCPGASVILLGCKLDLRENINTIKDLAAIDQRPVTYGQGLSVARRINSMAYVECSSRAEEGGMIDVLFATITKCCVLNGYDASQKRERRRSGLLNFRRRARSSSDLSDSVLSSISTTFEINSGRLLESRPNSVSLPIKPQSIREPKISPYSNGHETLSESKQPESSSELSQSLQPTPPRDSMPKTAPPISESKPLGTKLNVTTLGALRRKPVPFSRNIVLESSPVIPVMVNVSSCGFPAARTAPCVNMYTIDFVTSDKQCFRIVRSGHRLRTLHIQILGEFLNLNGQNGESRSIPYMPRPATIWQKQPLPFDKYQGPLQMYMIWLLNTPEVLAHNIVQQFFAFDKTSDQQLENALDQKELKPVKDIGPSSLEPFSIRMDLDELRTGPRNATGGNGEGDVHPSERGSPELSGDLGIAQREVTIGSDVGTSDRPLSLYGTMSRVSVDSRETQESNHDPASRIETSIL